MQYSTQSGFIRKGLLIIVVGIAIFVLGYRAFIVPPSAFPTPYHLTIESGQTLFSISHELEADNVIKSPRAFEILMLTFGNETDVTAGEYYFDAPMTVVDIAMRISGKQFGIDKKKVTFPEGFSTVQMAERLESVFPEFNTSRYLELAQGSEGYLFPDTYGFFPSLAPEVVIAAQKRNFEKKIAPFEDEIAASGHSLSDIVIMASLIEKEASGASDRGLVSGILWKRIEEGMPLQVDAPFLYIIGKTSAQLTRSDLAKDHPYNTYRNKGLTPGPIGNPGIASIVAALRPVESPYLYYLHDDDGQIHYASTYKEHQQNITKYLK